MGEVGSCAFSNIEFGIKTTNLWFEGFELSYFYLFQYPKIVQLFKRSQIVGFQEVK